MIRRRWVRLVAVIALPVLSLFAFASPASAEVSSESTIDLVAPSTGAAHVAPSPDGKMLYATDWTNQLLLRYDLRQHSWLTPISVLANPVGIAVTSDSKKVVVAGTGGIDVVDAVSTHVTHVYSTQNFDCVAVSPNATYAYAGSYGADITKFNLRTGVATDIFIGIAEQPQSLAISPDGSKVYVATLQTNALYVVSTSTDTVSAPISVGNFPTAVAVSPDGKHVYVLNRNSGTVSVYSPTENAIVASVSAGDHPFGITVSPDSSQFVVSSTYTQQLLSFSTSTNAQLSAYTVLAGGGSSQPGDIAFAANGASIYASLPGAVALGIFGVNPPLPLPVPDVDPLPDTGVNLGSILGIAGSLIVAGAAISATAIYRRRKGA